MASVLRIAILKAVFVVLLAGLTGCGFQLRGQLALPPVLERTYLQVAAGDRSTLYQHLKAGLQVNGVSLVTDRNSATAVVEVGGESVSKQTLVKSSSGSALEYELFYSVDFRVTGADGKALISRQDVRLSRDLLYDNATVIGRDTGETRATEDMRKDAAQAILRRIAALSSAQPAR